MGTEKRAKVEAEKGAEPVVAKAVAEIPPKAQPTPAPPPQRAKRDPRDNLRMWQPGQSGNPSGRPKSPLSHLREMYGPHAEREILAGAYGFALNRPELANRDRIPAREQAQMMQYLIDRIWGKADSRTQIEVSGGIGVVQVQLTDSERQQIARYIIEGRLEQVAALAGQERGPEDGQEDGQAIDVGYEVLPLPGGGQAQEAEEPESPI